MRRLSSPSVRLNSHSRPSRRFSVPVLFLLGASQLYVPSAAFAADVPEKYREIMKRSQVLERRPSTDISPVDFSVGNVRYRVPRNYVVWMDNWNGGPQFL